MPMRGVSGFSKETLLSHSTKKLSRGTFLCFTKVLVPENFYGQEGGGRKEYHDVLSIFLSRSTEKLRRGTFLFPTKILASKYFMVKRWGVKEGGVSRYSFKNF